MGRKPKFSLLQHTKKWGVTATVATLPFLGLGAISISECGGVFHAKSTASGHEVLLDKRNCKAPTIADDPEKPLKLDHTNDTAENEKRQVD